MIHKKPKIKINEVDYDLKITLGFWKSLSFKRSEIATLRDNPKRIIECLTLAIFYGNKKKLGWKSLIDMEKIISQECFDELETDPYNLLSDAFYYYLPENLKKMADKIENEELKEENLKKK